MDINTLYRPGRKLFFAQKSLYSFLTALRPFLGLNTNYFQHLLSFSHSVVSNSLQLHGLQPDKLPCPSPSPSYLILCRPLLLMPSVFPSTRIFSNELTLRIRWPKYWSFSFRVSPSNEYLGLLSFTIDWFDVLAVQGTLV